MSIKLPDIRTRAQDSPPMVAVGRTTATGVRIWCRTSSPGHHVLKIHRRQRSIAAVRFQIPRGGGRDNTCSVAYPDDFDGTPLAPGTLYGFRVETESGELVGSGRFETSPAGDDETAEDFSIGVMSCHQPFNDDGMVSKARTALLAKLPGALARENLKFILAVGDQTYSDSPGRFSLFNHRYAETLNHADGPDILKWSEDEIRRAYHHRYRASWSLPAWRKLIASYPTYPILDDHEVVDDWGSVTKHHSDAKWKRLIRAARRAYMDYQGSFTGEWLDARLPPSHDYGFRYGHTAVYVLDVRSERRKLEPTRVLSDRQRTRFKRFLLENTDARVLLIVSSVPLLHLPEWLTRAGHAIAGDSPDFLDHWNTAHNSRDRGRILTDIETQLELTGGEQKIICIGGDVHLSASFVCTWRDPAKFQFYQFTSSPISTGLDGFAKLSKLGPEAFGLTPTVFDGRLSARLLRPAQRRQKTAQKAKRGWKSNPMLEQNFGLIDVRTRGATTNVRFRYLGYPEDGVGDAFATGWL